MRGAFLISARAPEASVQWVWRAPRIAEGSRERLREIELPEDWSTEAAEALLRQGGTDRASVREWVRAVGASFETQGREESVRLAAEDITQWKRQLEGLLLTQSALVCLPEVWRSVEGGGREVPAQACAGLRLTRFLEPDGRLNCRALRQAIRLVLLVLLLARNRSGVGLAGDAAAEPRLSLLDLAALLMASGVPYDSEIGRALSVAVSALVSADLTLHGQGWLSPAAEGGPAASTAGPMVTEAQRRLDELDRVSSPEVEARIVPIRRDAAASAQEAEAMPPLVRQLPELLQLARSGWSEIGRRARHNELTKLVLVGQSRPWIVEALDCDGDEVTPLRALTVEERRSRRGTEGARRRAKHVVGAGLDRLRYSVRERDAIVRELERSGTMMSTRLQVRHRPVFAVRGVEGNAPGPGAPALDARSEERMRVALRLFTDLGKPAGRENGTEVPGLQRAQGEDGGGVEPADSRLLQEHAALLAMRVSEELTTELRDAGARSAAQGGETAAERRREMAGQESRAGGPDSWTEGVERVWGVGSSNRREAVANGSEKANAMPGMPAERQALTHSFRIGGREGTLTVGLFHDGRLGEIYLRMPRESSAVKGLLDAFSTATSVALQHGVSLGELTGHFAGLHFEPSGETANPEIPTAQSPMDYLFRWLEVRFAPLLSSS